jgi:putative endopeptidase
MKILPLILAGFALTAVGLTSCKSNTEDSNNYGGKPKDFKFIDRANMDTSVSPAENFFRYANGTWLKNTQIPSDQTRWGSFNIVHEETQAKLDSLMVEVSKNTNAAKGSNDQMVADFFKSGMDTAQIEKAGLAPMKPTLDRINAISNSQELLKEVALEQTQGLGQLFGFGVAPDDKDVTNEICQFYQGGLGLSPKSAYFDTDQRSVANRAAYIQYIHDMLVQMGEDDATATKGAQSIFNLEKALASASLSPVEMRNPQKLYNKYDIKTIDAQTPNFDWAMMLKDLNTKDQDSVIIGMPDFFKEVSKQLKATPIDVWKQYLAFHAVSSMSPYLSSNFSDLHFNFYGKVIYGQKEQKPRWQRVIRVVDGSIGDALGQLYVAKYFPPKAKERMNTLVNNLQDAFAERIKNLDWMSDVTKQKALAKLKAFTKKIAYPDKWKDYAGVTIVPDNYVQNVLNASKFEYDYNVDKLGKPVDKTEWGMTPPTINAYYNPGFNEIVFPAGILQFPFFDFNADDAVHYGGIGAVIGHEMTHGFDDQGSQYDAQGYLKNWWTPEDSAKFAAKTNIVREQFDGYRVLDSVPVNGSLTLGENLADLGGVTIAYDAFKKTKEGQSNEKIDGFTPDQRFFLSWAQVWRGKSTPETLAKQVKTDPHSPTEFRCNGPLSNFEPFYKAFNVKEGDKMWRPDSIRAKVW